MDSPAALRDIGSFPTSTQTVWLLDHPPQPQPGGERQAAQRLVRRLAQVEDHEAEVAGLQHEAERLHRLLHRPLVQAAAQPGVGDHVPAHPEQAREIDAGRSGRRGIEHVEGIDQRHQLTARGCGRHRLQQQAGASRRAGTDHFREMPARESAAEAAVERGEAGGPNRLFIPRVERGQRRGERPVETPFPEGGDECVAVSTGSQHIFAFCSPSGRTIAQAFPGDQARGGVG